MCTTFTTQHEHGLQTQAGSSNCIIRASALCKAIMKRQVKFCRAWLPQPSQLTQPLCRVPRYARRSTDSHGLEQWLSNGRCTCRPHTAWAHRKQTDGAYLVPVHHASTIAMLCNASRDAPLGWCKSSLVSSWQQPNSTMPSNDSCKLPKICYTANQLMYYMLASCCARIAKTQCR
jgi:hypothetical protein